MDHYSALRAGRLMPRRKIISMGKDQAKAKADPVGAGTSGGSYGGALKP